MALWGWHTTSWIALMPMVPCLMPLIMHQPHRHESWLLDRYHPCIQIFWPAPCTSRCWPSCYIIQSHARCYYMTWCAWRQCRQHTEHFLRVSFADENGKRLCFASATERLVDFYERCAQLLPLPADREHLRLPAAAFLWCMRLSCTAY